MTDQPDAFLIQKIAQTLSCFSMFSVLYPVQDHNQRFADEFNISGSSGPILSELVCRIPPMVLMTFSKSR